MRRDQRGFTLVELMFTMVLIGIMIAIAVPSFASFISSYRATAAVNDLLEAISLTRSEALKRGRKVTLMPNDANRKPSLTGSYANGWTVFVHDAASDPTATYSTIAFPPDTLVSQRDVLPSSTTVAASDAASAPFAGANYFVFDGTGYARNVATGQTVTGGIVFTDRVGGSTNIRTLCMAAFGRPRIIKTSSTAAACTAG